MNQLSIHTFFLISTLMCAWAISPAQGIEGKITDTDGNPLPFATVYVKEIKRGTATNEDGRYLLNLRPGTYEVTFQYLGYQAQNRRVFIGETFVTENITLKIEPVKLGTVMVYGDREDPAYTIMRKAIAKARYHTQQIDRYTTTMYIKGSGRLIGLPFLFRKWIEEELAKEGLDSTTAFVTESVSEITYTRPNQYEEKVISVRTIGNDNNTSPNAFIKGSFYEPEIAEAVSPLSPRAFAYYRFEYLGEFTEGEYLVNKIRVIPRSRGDNVFEGIIYIVDQLWSIHSLDLATTIWGIRFNINQVYAPVEDAAWLPINTIYDVAGSLFGFKFEYRYFSNASDYEITLNPDLAFEIELIDETLDKDLAKAADKKLRENPEASAIEKLEAGEELSRKQVRKLLKEYEKQERKEFQQDTLENVYEITTRDVDSMAFRRDSIYWSEIRPIPLTQYEVKGYRVLDSIALEAQKQEEEEADSIAFAFGSTNSLPVRKKSRFEVKDIIFGGSYPIGENTRFALESLIGRTQFNTVDGYHVTHGFRFEGKRNALSWTINPLFRYAFARKKFTYRLLNQMQFGKRFNKWALYLNGGKHIFQLNADRPIHPAVNSFMTLFFERNFMKVYEKDFITIGLQKDIHAMWRIAYQAEWSGRFQLYNNSDSRIFDSKRRSYTSNVPFNREAGDTKFNTHQAFIQTLSVESRPWLRFRIRNGQKYVIENSSPRLSFLVRNSPGQFLGSDTRFTQIEGGFKHVLDYPGGGILNVNIRGGIFLDNSEMTFVDFKHFPGNRTPFATLDPAESFRLLDYYAFSTSEEYLTVFLNYQFRKFLITQSPFIRLSGMKESLILNVLETGTSEHYFEVGYGLNYIFRILRIEVMTSFQDWKFLDFGVRFGVAANLDTLFGN